VYFAFKTVLFAIISDLAVHCVLLPSCSWMGIQSSMMTCLVTAYLEPSRDGSGSGYEQWQ
jgi:hypothetical protein